MVGLSTFGPPATASFSPRPRRSHCPLRPLQQFIAILQYACWYFVILVTHDSPSLLINERLHGGFAISCSRLGVRFEVKTSRHHNPDKMFPLIKSMPSE